MGPGGAAAARESGYLLPTACYNHTKTAAFYVNICLLARRECAESLMQSHKVHYCTLEDCFGNSRETSPLKALVRTEQTALRIKPSSAGSCFDQLLFCRPPMTNN